HGAARLQLLGGGVHQEADLPVTRVIAERDGRAIGGADAAVRAEDEDLGAGHGGRGPAHAGILRQAEEIAGRPREQHLRGDGKRAAGPGGFRCDVEERGVGGVQNLGERDHFAGASCLFARSGRRLVSCLSMLNQNGAPRESSAAVVRTPGSCGPNGLSCFQPNWVMSNEALVAMARSVTASCRFCSRQGRANADCAADWCAASTWSLIHWPAAACESMPDSGCAAVTCASASALVSRPVYIVVAASFDPSGKTRLAISETAGAAPATCWRKAP